MSQAGLSRLWKALLERISQWDDAWYARLVKTPLTLRAYSPGAAPIPDRDVFEAFTLALLSGNTRWERIEAVRGDLGAPFDDFDRPGSRKRTRPRSTRSRHGSANVMRARLGCARASAFCERRPAC